MAEKNKFLLHICCAGCGVYIASRLQASYEVILFFYNPSIFPVEEYLKRLEEAKKISRLMNLKLIVGRYGYVEWLKLVAGYEKEPEKGERCLICYRDRLEETAREAKKRGILHFGATLSVSPHKNAAVINKIGSDIAKKNKISFLARDFKINNGFNKSAALVRKLKLYRQKYCGCEFSKK